MATMRDMIDSIQSSTQDQIIGSGHWGYIKDDWREIAGHFNIDVMQPTFNVYYYSIIPKPGHGYNISKYIADKSTFSFCTREEMLIERPEYLI